VAATFAERPRNENERYRLRAGTFSFPVAPSIGTVPSKRRLPVL